jgi:hypothetical protein
MANSKPKYMPCPKIDMVNEVDLEKARADNFYLV